MMDRLIYGVGKDGLALGKHNVVPVQSASIDYGNGFFEGEMFYLRDGDLVMFHPVLNIDRMAWGMYNLFYEWPGYSVADMIRIRLMVAMANGWIKPDEIDLNGKDRAYIRMKAVSMKNALGLGMPVEWEILTSIIPVGLYLGERAEREGATVLVSPMVRRLAFPDKKVFSNYQLSMVLRRYMAMFSELTPESAADEVIFMDTERRGFVEGSGENIAIVKDGKFITPPTSEGCLPGITMYLTTLIAEEMGLRVERGIVSLEDMKKADVVLFTGNYAGLVAIRRLVWAKTREKGRALPEPVGGVKKVVELKSHARHPIFLELKERYEKLKEDELLTERAREWIPEKTFVESLNITGRILRGSQDNLFKVAESEKIKPPRDFRKKVETIRKRYPLFRRARLPKPI